MVGRDQCVVQTTSDTVITCIAPQRDEPVTESVTVSGHTAPTVAISLLPFRCHLDRISTTVWVRLIISVRDLLLTLLLLLVESLVEWCF